MQSVPLSPGAFAISAVGHVGLFAALLAATALWQNQESKVYIVNLIPSVAAVGSPQGKATSSPTREAPAPRAATFKGAAPQPSAPAPSVAAVPPPPARAAARPAARAKDTLALPERPTVRETPTSPARASGATAAPALPPPRLARRLDGDEPAPRTRKSAEPPAPRMAQVTPSDTAARRAVPRDVPLATPNRPAPVPPELPPDTPRRPLPGAATPAPAADTVGTASRLAALPRPGQKDPPSLASPMPSLAPLPPVPLAAPTARLAPAAPAPVPAAIPALGQATGSPQGKGAITMNVSDFPFAWYLQTVQRKINEKWSPPARGAESRAVIVFEIGRNGDVRRPGVENSSGDSVYDQAALRAVADAHPFPPLPADYRPQVLKIYLGFDFSANRS